MQFFKEVLNYFKCFMHYVTGCPRFIYSIFIYFVWQPFWIPSCLIYGNIITILFYLQYIILHKCILKIKKRYLCIKNDGVVTQSYEFVNFVCFGGHIWCHDGPNRVCIILKIIVLYSETILVCFRSWIKSIKTKLKDNCWFG